MNPDILSQIREGGILYILLLIAVTMHEFGHAFFADKLGDPLPRLQDRVTINPLAHMDTIGTVVLPQADLKIFLTASVDSRARRRYLEVQAKGGSETYEDIAASIAARDDMDSHRAVSPLKKADDAIVVDNSDLDLEQTADVILGLMKERG